MAACRLYLNMYNSLNQDSMQRINNIVANFRAYPAYSAFQIRSFCYNAMQGIHAIEITRNGNNVNLLLFYPEVQHTGKIGSIAMYGANLQGHYNAMKSSMNAFGMPIYDITMEEGRSPYIDITLDY